MSCTVASPVSLAGGFPDSSETAKLTGNWLMAREGVRVPSATLALRHTFASGLMGKMLRVFPVPGHHPGRRTPLLLNYPCAARGPDPSSWQPDRAGPRGASRPLRSQARHIVSRSRFAQASRYPHGSPRRRKQCAHRILSLCLSNGRSPDDPPCLLEGAMTAGGWQVPPRSLDRHNRPEWCLTVPNRIDNLRLLGGGLGERPWDLPPTRIAPGVVPSSSLIFVCLLGIPSACHILSS